MQKIESANNLIKEICLNIKGEHLEQIDFDRLRETLSIVQVVLDTSENTAEELALLKNEYRQRILGMLKAVVACRPTDDDSELAVQLADCHAAFDSAELIRLYSRMAARFRTCFPASFKYIVSRHPENNDKNWKEYKL